MNSLNTSTHRSERLHAKSTLMSRQFSQKPSQAPPTDDTLTWLSVFIGDPSPASPRLNHIRLPAKTPKNIFNYSKEARDSLFKTSSLSPAISISLAQHDASNELSIFHAIVSLALTCEQELLNCVNGSLCVVCHDKPVQSFVFRPLCITRHGYGELSDFGDLHHLMMTIASHTTHITRRDEACWSIGSFLSDIPYICLLAIPVCSGDSRCRRVAAERSQGYIAGILDGTVKAHPLEEGPESNREPDLHRAEMKATDSMTRIADNKPVSLNVISNPVDTDGGRFCTIGATVFICGANLQSSNPRLNPIGCIALSARWPQTILPVESRNELPQTNFYQNITKHYEHKFLEHIDPYCAVCRQPTNTTKLTHVPYLVLRTDRKTPDERLAKSLVMNFCRLFPARWKFPEVNHVLGVGCDVQVFALVVPVCVQTVCAELADVSAKVLIQSALPSNSRLPEIGRVNAEQCTSITTYPDKEAVRVLVKKLPRIDSHTESEKKHHKKARNPQKETVKSCAPDQQNTEEEDEVWIYRADEGSLEDRSDDARSLAAEYEQLLLFQPLLNFDFWLLHGAIATAVHSNVQRPRRNSV